MALASLGVIGTGFGDGTDTLKIPVDVDVIRSDPTLGASVVVVFSGGVDAVVTGVSDDAPTDAFYSTHLYTAGTNPYNRQAGSPPIWRGLCLNPLSASTPDNIILQLASTSLHNFAIAVAYTGAQVDNQSNPTYQVPDLPSSTWFDGSAIPCPFGICGANPPGPPEEIRVNWEWNNAGPPRAPQLLLPSPLVYPAWSIETGEIALYFVLSSGLAEVDPGDFVPDDGSWAEIGSIINTPTGGTNPPSFSVSVFEKTLSAPELDDDLDGAFTTIDDMFGSQGFGYMMLGGLGPIWLDVPPPFGGPVFSHRHRAAFPSEAPAGTMGAGAPDASPSFDSHHRAAFPSEQPA